MAMKTKKEVEKLFGPTSHKDIPEGITLGEYCTRLLGMDKSERYDYLTWWAYSFIALVPDGASLIAQPDLFLKDFNGMLQNLMERHEALYAQLEKWMAHDCEGADCSVCGDLEGEAMESGLPRKK